MPYIIESNIPVPEGSGKGRAKGELRLTLEAMKPSQSIVVEGSLQRDAAQSIAKQCNFKLKTRMIKDTNTYRVWRIK